MTVSTDAADVTGRRRPSGFAVRISIFFATELLIGANHYFQLVHATAETAVIVSLLMIAIVFLFEILLQLEQTRQHLTEATASIVATVEARAAVVDYLLKIALALPTERDRRSLIERILESHGHLLASTNPLIKSLHRALLQYFDQWLEVHMGEHQIERIRVHATSAQTYPIYRACISETRNCAIIRAINDIDLQWWLSPDGLQYIEDNLRAVNENRVSKIERTFVIRTAELTQEKLDQLKIITDMFAPVSNKASLFAAVVDGDPLSNAARIDAVVFKGHAALEWELQGMGSDQTINVCFSDEGLRKIEANIDSARKGMQITELSSFIVEQQAALATRSSNQAST